MNATVRIAANFERNLEDIRALLESRGGSSGFEELLDHLFGTMVPNLERFPEIGPDFLARKPASIEGRAAVDGLVRRLPAGATIRE